MLELFGPVRTGKSTFIKRFMDLLVIPNIDNEYKIKLGNQYNYIDLLLFKGVNPIIP